MIRFCDKEVYCVRADELSRSELFSYFLGGHREDVLCVTDDSGKFIGSITYTSLLQTDDIAGSIRTEKAVLNEHFWENGKKYFENYEKLGDEIVLLPVTDRKGQLLCFAYQDEDANREIRQLRELNECKDALNFRDIFPQYDCVTIWECNELAYVFLKYLRKIGVPVRVEGSLWGVFDDYVQEVYESLEYRNLNIYAEGTWKKCENLREYLLRSVSVEFECIDIIYESNIKKGIIKDTAYGFEELLKKSKESEKIVLKDIGEDSLAACNLFLENGIKQICFLTKNEDDKRLIGGMHMFTMNELRKLSEKIIFVDCMNEHSAWGPDELDYYDYIGYRRNEKYFCLKDYIDLPHSDLKYLLRGKDVVLTGDVLLCKKFYLYYKQEMQCKSIVYYNILNDSKADKYHGMMPVSRKSQFKKTDLFLIYAPEYSYSINEVREQNKQNKNNIAGQVYADLLCQEGYYNYLLMYNEIPDDQIFSNAKYTAHELKPKLIVAGALLGDCGNVLLRNMLSGHSKIIKMEYGLLNEHLILFCIRLSGEKASDILSIFWELVTEAVGMEYIRLEFHDTVLFHKKMAEMLQIVGRPTSQELFVIFHLAYVAMYGKDISDVSDYIIYWEKHGVHRAIHPKHIKWLDAEGIEGLVITNSRNSIVRAGGLLKHLKTRDYFERTDSLLLRTILEEPEEWKDKESVWKSIEIKFEELKCNPQEVMDKIGDIAGVSFSEILDGTIYGGQVKYNDMEQIMKPVYNAYEEYLSLFDKMRISLLTLNWQKKRDYPLVDYSEITRKDLQEMYLREFRFEKELVFSSEEEYLRYRQGRQRWLRQRFSSLRSQISGEKKDGVSE